MNNCFILYDIDYYKYTVFIVCFIIGYVSFLFFFFPFLLEGTSFLDCTISNFVRVATT